MESRSQQQQNTEMKKIKRKIKSIFYWNDLKQVSIAMVFLFFCACSIDLRFFLCFFLCISELFFYRDFVSKLKRRKDNKYFSFCLTKLVSNVWSNNKIWTEYGFRWIANKVVSVNCSSCQRKNENYKFILHFILTKNNIIS